MKTDIHLSCKDCSLCGKEHKSFRAKKDSKGILYIICGSGAKAKRVNVILHDPLKSKNTFFPGKWTIDV